MLVAEGIKTAKVAALGPAFRQSWSLLLCEGKKPLGMKWQETQQTPESISAALERAPGLNVGVILGARSGLIDCECDTEQAAADLAELFGDDIPVTPSYTSRRGPHRFFKLHPRLEALGKSVVKCGEVELRLGGGGRAAQSLIPPSETDGFVREWIVSPDDCELAELPESVVDKIIAAQAKKAEPAKEASPTSLPRSAGAAVALRPGDDFNARGNWHDILGPHGWTQSHHVDGVDHWTRPGKVGSTSATTGYAKKDCGEDYLFVFSTNAPPLEADKAYSKFAAFATLNHGGDFSDAAAALAALGYGRAVEGDNVASKLVSLASDCEFFHSSDGETFATVSVDGHNETWRLSSGQFKTWLQRLYYSYFDKAVSSNALTEALGVMNGKALFDGREYEVHVRVGQANGKTYVDMANDSWQAVEITADGWQVVDNPPIKFRRPKGMLPLPTPERGGSIELLRKFVNVDDRQFPLLVAALVASLRGQGPYPVVILQGEQGSAKSTTARVIRSLVDPNVAPLRAEPKNGHDLIIAASNGLFVVFDNLSGVKQWLSDALCRLATGGGYSTRKLYENDEEQIFDVMRPTVLTGIDNPVGQSDLLDRALLIDLRTIPTNSRRAESELWGDFNKDRPLIIGALCDGVSAAMGNLDCTHLDVLPRMADFALWATSAETAFGWEPGTFMAAYAENRRTADNYALESPVAQAVLKLMSDKTQWEGKATQLMKELSTIAEGDSVSGHEWPSTASKLSGTLAQIAPNLREAGIDVQRGRNGVGRSIALRKV